jgi:hypothetical protein
MTAILHHWAHIHPSVFHNTAGPMRATEATPRPSGALRYRCPVNGSLVLVTDEATLAGLDRPRARLRCIDCGEMHLLTQEPGDDDAAALHSDCRRSGPALI